MTIALALVAGCNDGGGAGSVADAGIGAEAGAGGSGLDAAPRIDASPADARLADRAPPDAAAPDGPDPDGSPDGRLPPPDAAPPFGPRPRPMSTIEMSAPRGWRLARTLIHMHSLNSHDACDGDPKPGGQPNEPCLARLRAALCHNRIDAILLTDHPGTMAEVDFVDALLSREGDELVLDAEGSPIGNWIRCPGGGEVLLAAGNEGDLMPVLLRDHPADRGSYRRATPEGVAELRAAGGVVLQQHTEKHTVDALRPLGLDGLEIYNLHANLDPNGQLAEVINDLAALLNAGAEGPHPDLAFLALFRESGPALATWEALLPEQRLVGVAGSDIHENLPRLFPPVDGERIDSYRRLSSWFANYLLVEAVDLEAIRDALVSGRSFAVMEVLGPGDGFDFHALLPGGELLEMGAQAPFAAGTRLIVRPPVTAPGDTLEVRVLRITAAGSERFATFEGEALLALPIEVPVEAAGVYRVEVRIVPEHLRAELGSFAERLLRPHLWIYSNPIYLR